MRQISRSHGSKKSSNLTQIGRFRTLTQIWIHQWLRNDAQSLNRRGALLFFKVGHTSNCKVTRLKKSSILTQIGRFRTVTPVWIHWWIWNDTQSLMLYRRCVLLFIGVIHQISRSHGPTIDDFNPIWVRLLGRSQLSNPSDLPCSKQYV